MTKVDRLRDHVTSAVLENIILQGRSFLRIALDCASAESGAGAAAGLIFSVEKQTQFFSELKSRVS
jgi:hypothetical protein